MPGYTTILNLPYPLGNETANVPEDMQALAEAVELVIPVNPEDIGAASALALTAVLDIQAGYLVAEAQKQLAQDLNIMDLAVNLETFKGATLTGVTANIFVETFLSLTDITLSHGIYDSTNKKVYL
jgi:hypothetical protein